jgi:hypothetical protein
VPMHKWFRNRLTSVVELAKAGNQQTDGRPPSRRLAEASVARGRDVSNRRSEMQWPLAGVAFGGP